MSKNDQFLEPRRQSQYAIIFIVLRFIRKTISQVWPIFVAILLGRGSSSFDAFEIAIAGLGVFGMIASVLAYFKFYYKLTSKELVISRGILKKVKLNIPFERIQSVNFRQTFVHQFLSVAEVEIETAGSSEQETKIDALSMPVAHELRQRILEKKALLDNSGPFSSEDIAEVEETKEMIVALSNRDLWRVGITQNHFKPIGLIFSLLSSIVGYSYMVDHSGGLANEIYKFVGDVYEDGSFIYDHLSIFTISAFILVLIVISVLYSLVTSFLKYYNLKFTRSENKFHCEQGLITRREFAAVDKKIQILAWGQNIFEKIIGFYNVRFRQARSSDESRRQSQFSIPGCTRDKVHYITKSWLGESGQFDKYHSISIHYFIRRLLYSSFLFIGIITISYLFIDPIVSLITGLIYVLSILLLWITYQKKRYALNEGLLYIGGGVLGFSHAITPFYKIQNVAIEQNPYQSRRNLATLLVTTAAGNMVIPYIPFDSAIRMLDFFTYQVEISRKPWM